MEEKEAGVTAREAILSRVRDALGHKPGQTIPPPPQWQPKLGELDVAGRTSLFLEKFAALNGKGYHAETPQEANRIVAEILAGRPAVAAPTPFLESSGLNQISGVRWGTGDAQEWRRACATVDVGITSASYALADTGSLVMIAGPGEPRLSSLLPPIHIAVIPAGSILSGLDDLFQQVPKPAELSSSMVLVTGPSRTADIEQILVRGVHGPGEIHVVIVG